MVKQNYVWLFEGIGGAVLLAFIGWLYKLLFVSRKGEVNKTNNKSSVENSGNNSNTITVNINTPERVDVPGSESLYELLVPWKCNGLPSVLKDVYHYRRI